jgi:N-acetylglucosamine kinase-like BadF-type ATPase
MRILAIDGGGTQTRSAVFDQGGNLLGLGIAGSSNHIIDSIETVAEALRSSIGDALRSASVDPAQIHVVCAGTAGISPDGGGSQPILKVLSEILPSSRLLVLGDMVIALYGAHLCDRGAVVIAGTGSVAYASDGEGRFKKSGGWGHIIGDEGSGYEIAKEAMRAALRAYEGQGEETALVSILCNVLKLSNLCEVIDLVYKRWLDRSWFASLSKVVYEAALQGDKIALRIFQDAAEKLARMAINAVKGISPLDMNIPISYAGSVFRARRFILKPMKEYIAKQLTHAKVVDPILPPLGGAFLLGLGYTKRGIEEGIIANLKECLRNESVSFPD